eukprot:338413_1
MDSTLRYNFNYVSKDNLAAIYDSWHHRNIPSKLSIIEIRDIVVRFCYFPALKFTKYVKELNTDDVYAECYSYDLQYLTFENEYKTIKHDAWYSMYLLLFSENGMTGVYSNNAHYEWNIKCYDYECAITYGVCTHVELKQTRDSVFSKTFNVNLGNYYAFDNCRQIAICKENTSRKLFKVEPKIEYLMEKEHVIKMILELNGNRPSFIRWEIDGLDVFKDEKISVSAKDNVIFYPFLQIFSGKFDSGLHIEVLQ